jgi:hypothetical protein
MLASDTLRLERQIHGFKVYQINLSENQYIDQLGFSGAQYSLENPHIPFYSERIPISATSTIHKVMLENMVYGIPEDDLKLLPGISSIGESIEISYNIAYERAKPYLIPQFVPLRINPYNTQFEYLIRFDLVIITEENGNREARTQYEYAPNSVLAAGDWYKLAVRQDGVYRISYTDLQDMGLNPGSFDPRDIRIYGNGGGMLPESLNEYRADDLLENAILVMGEEDGQFNQGDYILFYGQSPHRWNYNASSGHFNHIQHLYSDETCYFLTTSLGPGKRIGEQSSVAEPANFSVDKFIDYEYHERDLFNLINAGRVWYGELFEIKTSYDTTFSFPDIDLSSEAYFKAYVAAKSTATSTFRFYDGSNLILTGAVNGIPGSSETYARNFIGTTEFNPSASDLNIRVEFQKPTSSSAGWLNYLEVNVTRNLRFSGPQMDFRAPQAISDSSIAEFALDNAGNDVQIWDVTDPVNVTRIKVSQNGNNQLFRLNHDSLREFIAWNGQSFGIPKFKGMVMNQDLHGMKVPDMLIISHEMFLPEAERLAGFHRELDGMTVEVVDIQDVYNEFSSGVQDVTAIRNLTKMLMDKSTGEDNFRYLLLFGDASFDYKDRIKDNTNFVPTWEAEESLTIVYSIASDDYYGFLDGPGDNLLDIGIGRLPVETAEQAKQVVDKIIHYATNTELVMQDWRNVVTFVADDEDANLHFNQAEEMAIFLDTNYGAYNLDKIYVDAFPQLATAGGQRTPDVNKAINNRISKGTLVMNFTGHGGEVGWGHERFLEISDINSWRNIDMLPIFITATCEFSRYDDPERLSAGEMVFRNPEGGAIAMFTTARATFGGSNFNLNKSLFEVMFEKDEEERYRFGDLIRIAKNKNGVVDNDKKFILLGDPALKLSYPEHKVLVSSVNGIPVSQDPDTLRALSTVEVTGEVVDETGSRLENFNGTLHSIVFDKPSIITTLNTDESSRPAMFELQNNTLYKGKAHVENGQFRFSFIVPKDIAYSYGFGKISFYAETENIDANGYYRNLVIGGFNPDAGADIEGPEIEMYMNDDMFQFGGITDENPLLLAYVSDESGINTVGSGIGHDIVAVLDGNTDKPFILNDYYEADVDSYTSGTIQYRFLNLSPGLHTLSLKVWDVYNNSGEAYLEFFVNPSTDFSIEHLYNYPNPFNQGTYFIFEHNQPEMTFDVTVRIFNLMGQVVKVFETQMESAGYRSTPIYWNGCDNDGSRIAKGAYIYRLTVRDSNGRTLDKSGKLIKTD